MMRVMLDTCVLIKFAFIYHKRDKGFKTPKPLMKFEEMRLKYQNISWYRINNNPLTTGSIMITIYGECKNES
jgi:hypothetical protein